MQGKSWQLGEDRIRKPSYFLHGRFKILTFPCPRSAPCGSAWRWFSAPRVANQNQTQSSAYGSQIKSHDDDDDGDDDNDDDDDDGDDDDDEDDNLVNKFREGGGTMSSQLGSTRSLRLCHIPLPPAKKCC